MNYGLAGKFEIHRQKVLMKDGQPVVDEKGSQILIGERELAAKFDNLITDVGLDNIGKGVVTTNYTHLSTNNAEPLISDTKPQGVIASSSSRIAASHSNNSTVTPPFFTSSYSTVRFEAGVGTGNISKIYMGGETVSDDIWSAALIRDSSGAVTTLTKLSDEVLDITYILYFYVQNTDVSSVINLSGVEYNVVIRLANFKSNWCNNFASPALVFDRIFFSPLDIVNKTSAPDSLTQATLTNKPYTPLSFKKSAIFSASLSQCNFPIRSAIVFGIGFTYQIRFGSVANDTPIPKTADFKLILPDFELSWGRYVAP